MKKLLIALIAITLMASFCYAKPKSTPAKATTPVGAVTEMSAVFVGRVLNVVDDSLKGKFVAVADEEGTIKTFPVDDMVKIADTSFNALTLNQIKRGSKVSVEYSKEGGTEKTKSIKVTK